MINKDDKYRYWKSDEDTLNPETWRDNLKEGNYAGKG